MAHVQQHAKKKRNFANMIQTKKEIDSRIGLYVCLSSMTKNE